MLCQKMPYLDILACFMVVLTTSGSWKKKNRKHWYVLSPQIQLKVNKSTYNCYLFYYERIYSVSFSPFLFSSISIKPSPSSQVVGFIFASNTSTSGTSIRVNHCYTKLCRLLLQLGLCYKINFSASQPCQNIHNNQLNHYFLRACRDWNQDHERKNHAFCSVLEL